MSTYPESAGSPELVRGLEELLEVGWRSIAAYRAAESVVRDHRLQAALVQLRRDHERHAEELTAILGELGIEVRARDGGGADGRLGAALEAAAADGGRVLDALRRAEADLRAAYERQVARGYAEPIRAVLSRHRIEETAHEEWLTESEWWRALRDEAPES